MEEEGARGGGFKRPREGAWERDIGGGPGTCLHWFLPFASKKNFACYSAINQLISASGLCGGEEAGRTGNRIDIDRPRLNLTLLPPCFHLLSNRIDSWYLERRSSSPFLLTPSLVAGCCRIAGPNFPFLFLQLFPILCIPTLNVSCFFPGNIYVNVIRLTLSCS
jgi:hypothetical protein